MAANCLSRIFLSLFVVICSVYGASIDSPVFGYHMRIGVPQAVRISSLESMRIVGGSAVSAATAIPHQVGIVARLTTGQQSVCGGSLLSTTRVLTAAHCWFDGEVQARQFTIVLGSLTIFTGGTRIDTTDVTMHPSWNYLLNDIAMVKISAVQLSTTIQVIPLPTAADVNQNFAGTTGVISGFGKTSDAQTSFPTSTALHQTSVPIITNAVCQRSYQITIDGSHLCTAGTGGKGTCDGDSGGPLTVLHNNKRILVGVVSFGPSEGCQASSPSVFSRVTSFLTWINNNLK
ncbi:brachyurin-like [Spodoptera litura]|uniref:Brachyurin-like n=1 Tax=Spodoptera litura TaxID=69820 RepID=A0A9J7EBU7_SPOLT|nr:brachyurin-like [Spodoptera litura]